jgi:type VI secretion system protein VasI
VVLSIAEANPVSGWLATSVPRLYLRCQEKRTEAFIVTGMSASVETGAFQLHTVRLRYDEDAATSLLMSDSTNDKALFFPNSVAQVTRMLSAKTLLVGLTPFNASPVSFSFDLEGLATAIEPLREACGW